MSRRLDVSGRLDIRPGVVASACVKLFDFGQEAYGVIAIGQFATGVFAFGQVATGVVAIGQVARGVFVVGQVAVGVVSVGQLAVGLYAAYAMLGLAGRRGGGLVLTILPRTRREDDLPPLVPAADVISGKHERGWARVRVAARTVDDGPKEVVLLDERSTLPIELAPGTERSLGTVAASDWPVALVELSTSERSVPTEVGYREAPPTERVVTAVAARESPRPEWTTPAFWLVGTARLAGFAAMCVVYWLAVGRDLVELLTPK